MIGTPSTRSAAATFAVPKIERTASMVPTNATPVVPRVVDEPDPDARGDDDRRDAEVAEQLPARAEVERVVHQADREAEDGGHRGQREARRPDFLGDEERMAVDAIDEPEREDA